MIKPVRKAVFPVAGMGTRFLPATKAVPKEMLTVVDKPIIQYAMEEAMAAGIEQFIFVTGRNKSAIDSHFDHAYELESVLQEKNKNEALAKVTEWMPSPGQVFFTRQHAALGLGHAVWCARHLVGDEPFAVLLPDDMILSDESCLKQMLSAYNQTGGNLVASEEVSPELTHQYGIIEPHQVKGRLTSAKRFVEKPKPEDAPSNLAVIGRYVLQPEIFDVLENQERGAGGEIQLTDAINHMTANTDTHGFRFEGERFDCGNRLGFVEANIAYALKRADMHDRVKDMLVRYQDKAAVPATTPWKKPAVLAA
ncbi:MAG: UTP--glucose-1-phosphate uridylyltransferase GalU [Alphaproteobacteria bacterium]|nr:UTP--glucose-1-phosphate uridylyltransferase GalU [Alphaproteobacteria bacterium]